MKDMKDPAEIVHAFFRDFFRDDNPGGTISERSFLAAVSGGADSVFLLVMLHRILPALGGSLSVVTVNHRIRSEALSGGDADFVENLCASLDPPIPCYRIDLPPGSVDELAAERGRGVEEAARFARYRSFHTLSREHKIDWICTGHTRDDQLETLLMRTIQGGGTGSLRGIASRTNNLVRPLLNVSRKSLEDWLRNNGFSWREDHTNRETRFFRNRIRSRLVPVLDTFFTGWKRGLLAGSSRAALDEDFINSFPLPQWKREAGGCSCSREEFRALHPALRLRFLYQGFVFMNVKTRVPYTLVSRMIHAPDSGKDGLLVSGAGIAFHRRDTRVFLESDIVQNRKSGYLVYITSCGEYEFPFGTLRITGEGESVYIDGSTGPCTLPLIVRSRMGGDTVQTAGGGSKTVKKIMNDWSVRDRDRDVLPVIECDGTIRVVYGTPLGYPRWYVRRQESNDRTRFQ